MNNLFKYNIIIFNNSIVEKYRYRNILGQTKLLIV